jgi:hypothetical protein
MTDKNMVYVVTRRGRRVEPRNYEVESEAQERASKLIVMLKQYSPACVRHVSIIKTINPNTIC